MKHWNRLPEEAPSLGIFNIHMPCVPNQHTVTDILDWVYC